MRIMLHPTYLYKYRSVGTREQLGYVLQTINDNILYFPRANALNDPMEATALDVGLCVIGEDHHRELGVVHPVVQEIRNEYAILSLSSKPDSTTMWAHYTAGYAGCCFMFEVADCFRDIRPVIYSDENFSIPWTSDSTSAIEDCIEESLFFKNTSWAYENEWRIVRKTSESFFSFNQGELMCVVLGERIKSKYEKKIVKLCNKKGIFVYRAKIFRAQRNIVFVPYQLGDGLQTNFDVENYFDDKILKGIDVFMERQIYVALNRNNDFVIIRRD